MIVELELLELVKAYYEASFARRVEVAVNLGLVRRDEPGIMDLGAVELSRLILQRARCAGNLTQLGTAVAA